MPKAVAGSGVRDDADDVGVSVRRLTSRFSLTSRFNRSLGLVHQILRQWTSRKSANAMIASRACRSMAATAGSWAPVDPVANAAQPREVAQVLHRGGSAGH